ncbi:hypothetical protein Hanom_Chr02g00098651 [Helianthus anomalus]
MIPDKKVWCAATKSRSMMMNLLCCSLKILLWLQYFRVMIWAANLYDSSSPPKVIKVAPPFS